MNFGSILAGIIAAFALACAIATVAAERQYCHRALPLTGRRLLTDWSLVLGITLISMLAFHFEGIFYLVRPYNLILDASWPWPFVFWSWNLRHWTLATYKL